jgi:hypothetical protein
MFTMISGYKIMRTFILIVSLVLYTCISNPSQLTDRYGPDCSTPSTPSIYPTDSNHISMVVEVYDYELKLIIHGENPDILAPNSIPIDVYWSGIDQNGKPVDPGKYLLKESIITTKKKTCRCSEVYIAK